MVGGEESHELRHDFNANFARLVDVEMGPGSREIGLEIVSLGISFETFVGFENFGGGSSGGCLVHEELAVRGSIFVLSLKSVGLIMDLMKRSSEDSAKWAGTTLSYFLSSGPVPCSLASKNSPEWSEDSSSPSSSISVSESF